MRCPTLNDLPPPPPGMIGWPWTEESPQLPDTMPDGLLWPKISIVTPSLNQGQFIEETIRSVFLQGYPDLEYIIIDGGSNDGSVDIIKKYEKWLTCWVSEPDRGQSHAINKGFNLSKGEIVAWINSDDLYLPDAFNHVSRFFIKNQQVHMVYGFCRVIDEKDIDTSRLYVPPDFNLDRLVQKGVDIPQPSVFFKRNVFEKVGGINEALHYSMDYDLWIKIGMSYKVEKFDIPLSCFRKHSQQKTYRANPVQYRENLRIRARYGSLKQKYHYIRHLIYETTLRK
jgi:glycosyltransferase involved in cell wall biosynthesis